MFFDQLTYFLVYNFECHQSKQNMGNKSSHNRNKTNSSIENSTPNALKLTVTGAPMSGKTTLLRQTCSNVHCQEESSSTAFEDRHSVILSCLRVLEDIIEEHVLHEELNMNILEIRFNYPTEEIERDILIKLQNIWNEYSHLYEGEQRRYWGISKYMDCFIDIYDGSVPITRDMMLRCYDRSIGISEYNLKCSDSSIVVLNGGSKSFCISRRLVIYTDVTAVIFTVSLTEYSEFSNHNQNILADTIEVFGELSIYRVLNNIPFVILFTKKDLLLNCLLKYPLPDDAPEKLRRLLGRQLFASNRHKYYDCDVSISMEQFQTIAPEVVSGSVLPYLTASEIFKLSTVNRYMYEICSSDQLWNILLVRDSIAIHPEHETVISVYKNNCERYYTMLTPYKYYYLYCIDALTEETIQYFSECFRSKITSNYPHKLSFYSVNQLEEHACEKVLHQIVTDLGIIN
jgi:GTPase SAR1 family protein